MQKQNLQHALVITHGGVIKLLACLARQQPLDDLLKMPAELGKLYSLEFSGNRWSINFYIKIVVLYFYTLVSYYFYNIILACVIELSLLETKLLAFLITTHLTYEYFI